MNNSRWFDFELAPIVIGLPVQVRLRDRGDRWVARVLCGTTTSEALGGSARGALAAALAVLGANAAARVMAAPIMFAASADLLAHAAM
jgi:hypothetical protein